MSGHLLLTSPTPIRSGFVLHRVSTPATHRAVPSSGPSWWASQLGSWPKPLVAPVLSFKLPFCVVLSAFQPKSRSLWLLLKIPVCNRLTEMSPGTPGSVEGASRLPDA